MTSLRLVPTLALAAAALLVLKVGGLVRDGGYVLVAPAVAGAPKTDKPKVEAGKPPEPGAQPPMLSIDRPREAQPIAPEGSAERALLERLGERRKKLDEMDEELSLRRRLLEAAEGRIEKRIQELEALEEKIGSAVKAKEDEKAKQARDLVAMYEAMKAKDAARVFDRLDPDLLVRIARAMNPRRLGDIVAKMEPEAAEKLTVGLAAGEQKPTLARELPKIEGK